MNKDRRTKIKNITMEIEIVKDKLQDILTEEEWAFDSMPENLQGTEQGERSQEAQECLSDVIDKLSEAIDQLGEIV